MKFILKKKIKHLLNCLFILLKPLTYFWVNNNYYGLKNFKHKNKVAIIACHWVGDTFWASQVFPILKNKWPESIFYVFTKSNTTALWNGLLPKHHIIPSNSVISDRKREKFSFFNLFYLAYEYRRKHFDLVIDLTGNRYSALFSFLLKPKKSIGFNGNEFNFLYSYNVKNSDLPYKHLSERPFRVIEPLFHEFFYSNTLTPPIPTENSENIFKRLNLNNLPIIMIAPGAGWKKKIWDIKNYTELASNLISEHQILIVGTANEYSLCSKINASIKSDRIKLLTGYTLDEIIHLLYKTKIFIGNDSGLGHIAAAIGVQTITIFTGTTDPEICGPIGKNVLIFNTEENNFSYHSVLQKLK